MKLFVVGQNKENRNSGVVWELHGVFDTKEEALRNCTQDNYFLGPVEMNKPFPHETVEWPGCYYPLAEKKGD